MSVCLVFLFGETQIAIPRQCTSLLLQSLSRIHAGYVRCCMCVVANVMVSCKKERARTTTCVRGGASVFSRNENQSKRRFSASALNIQAKVHYILGNNNNQAPLHSRTTPGYLSNSTNIPSQPGTTVVRMAL